MLTVIDKWEEAKKKLKDYVEHHHINLNDVVLSFSGGKDSTVCLQLIEELGWKNKIKIIFMDTRMEYQAIYDFIKQKQSEGWYILEVPATQPQPLIYQQYGLPFYSKFASEMLGRLQKHHFNFQQDGAKSYEELDKQYPNCRKALKWWCGLKKENAPKWLKQTLQQQGLSFKVHNKCCYYLKKKPAALFNKLFNCKLTILGIRKDEGGVRSLVYESCFHTTKDNKVKYFPLFWFSNEEIDEIIKLKNIAISKCYTVYKMVRTGCVGCPYSVNWKQELEVLKTYEPNKYTACMKMYHQCYRLYENRPPLKTKKRSN